MRAVDRGREIEKEMKNRLRARVPGRSPKGGSSSRHNTLIPFLWAGILPLSSSVSSPSARLLSLSLSIPFTKGERALVLRRALLHLVARYTFNSERIKVRARDTSKGFTAYRCDFIFTQTLAYELFFPTCSLASLSSGMRCYSKERITLRCSITGRRCVESFESTKSRAFEKRNKVFTYMRTGETERCICMWRMVEGERELCN